MRLPSEALLGFIREGLERVSLSTLEVRNTNATMGRGLGDVQRFVLDTLAQEPTLEEGQPWPPAWWRLSAIARRRYGRDPTPGELETVRSAIRALAKRGLVDVRPA
jgi:hypothetical protein